MHRGLHVCRRITQLKTLVFQYQELYLEERVPAQSHGEWKEIHKKDGIPILP